MKRSLVRRGAVGFALGALAASGLASVPAHAVITDGEIYTSTYFSDNGSCTESASAPSPGVLPFTDNNVPTTQAHAVSGQTTHNVNPADVTAFAASSTLTVQASPIGEGPATIAVSGGTYAQAATALGAASLCDGYAQGYVQAYGDFVLTKPMWATVTVDANGNGEGRVEINGNDGDLDIETAARSKGSVTALIPAGDVSIFFDFDSEAYGPSTDASDRVTTYSGKYRIDLLPLGHPSAVSGKGAGHVLLGARTCTTGQIAAELTKKAKKKAKKVVVKVNGAKAASFKGKSLKKKAFSLAVPPASAAEVVATITLKNGKKVTVTRSYLACS